MVSVALRDLGPNSIILRRNLDAKSGSMKRSMAMTSREAFVYACRESFLIACANSVTLAFLHLTENFN